jgi:hypothetical protein
MNRIKVQNILRNLNCTRVNYTGKTSVFFQKAATQKLCKLSRSICFVLSIIMLDAAKACQCPSTSLSIVESNKYEIIFKGKVSSVKACSDKKGEAVFLIEELYKGNTGPQFKVLFSCKDECSRAFQKGEEWIIYARYKQMDNALMDWCSRSRKYFKIDKEDYYTAIYGNDYEDELKFLKENLGVHRLLDDNFSKAEGRNIIPGTTQMVVILIVSLLVIILFYGLFNKYFR